MLTLLVAAELVVAAIAGLKTRQILLDLEDRLTKKLAVDYGHYPDADSDVFFSESMDFMQYKVSHFKQSRFINCAHHLSLFTRCVCSETFVLEFAFV